MAKLRPTGPGRTAGTRSSSALTSRVGRSRASEEYRQKVFDWIGQQGRDVGADALIGVLQRSAPGRTSRSIDFRWTAEVLVFRGFFGDLMRWLVAAAAKAFAKILGCRSSTRSSRCS